MTFETEQSRREFWGSWDVQVGSDGRKRVIAPNLLVFIRCFPVRGETEMPAVEAVNPLL